MSLWTKSGCYFVTKPFKNTRSMCEFSKSCSTSLSPSTKWYCNITRAYNFTNYSMNLELLKFVDAGITCRSNTLHIQDATIQFSFIERMRKRQQTRDTLDLNISSNLTVARLCLEWKSCFYWHCMLDAKNFKTVYLLLTCLLDCLLPA